MPQHDSAARQATQIGVVHGSGAQTGAVLFYPPAASLAVFFGPFSGAGAGKNLLLRRKKFIFFGGFTARD